jgi:hypothetical protein
MNKKFRYIPGFFLLATTCLVMIFASCKSRDKKHNPELNAESIYFDYKITAEEGYDNLTVLLKFRDENKTGEAFTIADGIKVLLDDEELFPDSSAMNGTYYEVNKPLQSFAGKHKIVLSATNGEDYTEEFNFSPLELLTQFPETVSREDFLLEFSGLENEDHIRLLLTDTVFFNDGINRIDTVRNNQLVISKNDLNKLAGGPILMELIREYERPVRMGEKAKGRLRINYTLRRTFNLAD